MVGLFLLFAQNALARGDSTAPARRHADYAAHAVCGAPAPGRARCMALQLVPRTSNAPGATPGPAIAEDRQAGTGAHPEASPAAGEFGLRPQDLQSAYELPTSPPDRQTIALVDAYNDPDAEADLATYSSEFGLPACTSANRCFTQVNQAGETGNPPFPRSLQELEKARKSARPEKVEQAEHAIEWSLEISLDIETAHAICQNCHILLVDANSEMFGSLEAGENAAAQLGATEISNSWGGSECSAPGDCANGSAFNHPGIVITAAAGDEGYLNWLERSAPPYANFPATSPDVVAVGGTRLGLNGEDKWDGETVWNDGGEREGLKDRLGATGGGCSAQFAAQAWQQAVSDWSAVGCGEKRAVADISADGDPYSGAAVYDSIQTCRYWEGAVESESSWCMVGGTSLGTPLIAAAFALAGGAGGVEYPSQTLYENVSLSPGLLHDVTEGSNGECLEPFDEVTGESGCTASEEADASCFPHAICLARAGYDGPTGLGTPDGIVAFAPHRQPTVTTGGAEATQTSATMRASVNPNGREVTACKFEYGTASVSEASVPCSPSPGAGAEPVSVQAAVTPLSIFTTYQFRIVARNADGTSTGETKTFSTLPEAPTVTAGGEAVAQKTSATVYGNVDPNGVILTACKFEYGTASGEYDASAPCTFPRGYAGGPAEVGASLTSLDPNASYDYRLVASNAGGTSTGSSRSFTTLASAPTVTPGATAEITQTSAIAGASVNPNGEPTECMIEYGATVAYGSSEPCEGSTVSGSAPVSVSAKITGLSPGTTYYYCVSATNETGSSECPGETFVTQLPAKPEEQQLAREQPGTQQVAAVQNSALPRGPDAQLADTSLTATAAGVLSMRVRCPASELSCAGTVTLRTLDAIVLADVHQAADHKGSVLTLASGAFKVAGGHTATVKLHLTADARMLLARGRVLRAKVVICAHDPAGAKHTTVVVATIRAADAAPL